MPHIHRKEKPFLKQKTTKVTSKKSLGTHLILYKEIYSRASDYTKPGLLLHAFQ